MSVQLIEAISDVDANIWLLDIGFVETNYSQFRRQKVDQFLKSHLPELIFEHGDGNSPCVINHELNMSISYSKNFAAIIVSKQSCGIDIQTKDSQIEMVSRLFLTENELQFIAKKNELFSAWSAKETTYKLLEGGVKSIKNDLRITSLNEGEIIIRSNGIQYDVILKDHHEFILSYCLK